jgi:ankyrin repeat protein
MKLSIACQFLRFHRPCDNCTGIQIAQPGSSSVDNDNMPMQRTMIHVCMGLVMIDQRSSIISLVHYSLQEYFQNCRVDFFRQGETTIAETCLTILSFEEFSKGYCYSDKKFEARLLQFPVYIYAACNWGHHAREAEKVNAEIILSFLQNDLKLSAASQAMFFPSFKSRGYSQRFPYHFTGVHAASFFGLKDIVNDLLVAKAEPDIMDGYGQRPLLLAARNGHIEVVERLLAANADVNAGILRTDGRTAIQAAAEGGYLKIVERLLAANANVNAAATEYGRTALQAAARVGHLEVVERLLTANAAVNAAGGDGLGGRTAIQAAAEGGHLEVVERLLTTNADVNAVGWHDDFTALQLAAKGGHLSVVERLLIVNADANAAAADFQGRTALQAAAEGGHVKVVKRLLAANADVNAAAAEHSGRTAL